MRSVVPPKGERFLYYDHVEDGGERLFQLICEQDLEGIVAERKADPYLAEHANWLKIRNRDYSQWVGREELVERERGGDPDVRLWDECALACVEAGTP
jgi:ATP-dependent DNA ligase